MAQPGQRVYLWLPLFQRIAVMSPLLHLIATLIGMTLTPPPLPPPPSLSLISSRLAPVSHSRSLSLCPSHAHIVIYKHCNFPSLSDRPRDSAVLHRPTRFLYIYTNYFKIGCAQQLLFPSRSRLLPHYHCNYSERTTQPTHTQRGVCARCTSHQLNRKDNLRLALRTHTHTPSLSLISLYRTFRSLVCLCSSTLFLRFLLSPHRPPDSAPASHGGSAPSFFPFSLILAQLPRLSPRPPVTPCSHYYWHYFSSHHFRRGVVSDWQSLRAR